MAFSIATEALQARLTIGQWTGRNRCRTLSKEAAERHSVDNRKCNAKRIESYVISLDPEIRRRIQRVADSARQYFNEKTMLWDLGNWRLLPAKNFQDVRRDIMKFKDEFTETVRQAIVDNYDKIRDAAEKELGDLIDVVGFPTKENLQGRYRFVFEQQPITDPSDLRVKYMDTEDVAVLKQEIQNRFGERLQKSVQSMIDAIRADVKYVADRMSKETTFRDSMLENKMQQINAIRDLNAALVSSPVIDKLCEEVVKTLGEYDPEVLRKDKEARKEFAVKMSGLDDRINAVKAGLDGEVVEEQQQEEEDVPEAVNIL